MGRRTFKNRTKEDISTHVFLTLDWTLIKRGENCMSAKIKYISFTDDCLVFQFAKSKGMQKGEDHVSPWHVYANPGKPWICPLLGLALYLLMFTDIIKGDVSLSPGKEKMVFTRYSFQFDKLKLDLKEELDKLGFIPSD